MQTNTIKCNILHREVNSMCDSLPLPSVIVTKAIREGPRTTGPVGGRLSVALKYSSSSKKLSGSVSTG